MSAPLSHFCIADDAGFVNVFVREAVVIGSRCIFPPGIYTAEISTLSDLTAFLCCVILVGEAALCPRFNLKSVGLCAMRGGAQCVAVKL